MVARQKMEQLSEGRPADELGHKKDAQGSASLELFKHLSQIVGYHSCSTNRYYLRAM